MLSITLTYNFFFCFMKKLLLLLITLVTLTTVRHASFPVSHTLKVKQNIEETIKYSSYGNSQTIVDQIFQFLGFLSLILSVVGLILILTPVMEDGVIRRIPIILFATTFGLIGLLRKSQEYYL